MINFAKMHGNGNDFIMVNSLEKEFNPKKSLIKKLGDRNLGIGFDQMIHIGAPSKDSRDFTVKFYLYGPVTSSTVIKTVQVDQYADIKDNAPRREQRYKVQPKPSNASADDDFGFNETTSFFEDAKVFDPVTGTDKEQE